MEQSVVGKRATKCKANSVASQTKLKQIFLQYISLENNKLYTFRICHQRSMDIVKKVSEKVIPMRCVYFFAINLLLIKVVQLQYIVSWQWFGYILRHGDGMMDGFSVYSITTSVKKSYPPNLQA